VIIADGATVVHWAQGKSHGKFCGAIGGAITAFNVMLIVMFTA